MVGTPMGTTDASSKDGLSSAFLPECIFTSSACASISLKRGAISPIMLGALMPGGYAALLHTVAVAHANPSCSSCFQNN